ncbi:hypothetical protein D3C81_954290 [compost metagenome]
MRDRSRWKISLTLTSGKANAWLPSITIRVGMIARVSGTLMTIFEPWPLAEKMLIEPLSWEILVFTTSMPTPRPDTSEISVLVEKPGAKIRL